MGQKKDTLLRWVECCSDSGTSVDRIKNLSDGRFFVHILSFVNGHSTDTNDPWLQTINVLRGISNACFFSSTKFITWLFLFQNTSCKKML